MTLLLLITQSFCSHYCRNPDLDKTIWCYTNHENTRSPHHGVMPKPPMTKHDMVSLTRRTEEEPPIPAQDPTPPGARHTHARHSWELRLNTQTQRGSGRGDMMRCPKEGLSAGKKKQKVLMCPLRDRDLASGHRAMQKPLSAKRPSFFWPAHHVLLHPSPFVCVVCVLSLHSHKGLG